MWRFLACSLLTHLDTSPSGTHRAIDFCDNRQILYTTILSLFFSWKKKTLIQQEHFKLIKNDTKYIYRFIFHMNAVRLKVFKESWKIHQFLQKILSSTTVFNIDNSFKICKKKIEN